MKKIFLSVLAIAAMATTANAQLWLGGSVNFSHSGGTLKTGSSDVDKPSSNSFTLAPMVGFALNDQLSVGGEVSLTSSTLKSDADFTGVDEKTSTLAISVTPFARYTFAKFNKLGVLAEAGLPIRSITQKQETGGNSVKGDPLTYFGLYVKPVLFYNLNDHFQLECGLDFMSLNAGHLVKKDKDDSDKKETTNTFSFGADTHNVVTVGNITIGFIYKL